MLRFYIFLLQKQLFVVVADVSESSSSSSRLFVSVRARSIEIITYDSRVLTSPSLKNASMTRSKKRYQLSSNITPPIDFFTQYATTSLQVIHFLRGNGIYNQIMENLLDEQTEETVIKYIPRNATLNALAEFFSACSDVTRAKIICALAISEMCVGDLSRILGINQTTCSHQLRLLRAADIVKQRRDGKIIYYSLKNRKIENVLLAGVDFLNL